MWFKCGSGITLPEMTITGRAGSNMAARGNDVIAARTYANIPNIGYKKADITVGNSYPSKVTVACNAGTGNGLDISNISNITISVTNSNPLPEFAGWYSDWSIRLYN